MTITLRPELEHLVRRAIKPGAFQTPDEVIESALEALYLEGDSTTEGGDSVHAKIHRGIAQFERGDFLTPGQLKDAMSQRKAAWLAQQQSK